MYFSLYPEFSPILPLPISLFQLPLTPPDVFHITVGVKGKHLELWKQTDHTDVPWSGRWTGCYILISRRREGAASLRSFLWESLRDGMGPLLVAAV